MLRTSPISPERVQAYATSSDFCRVFAEDSENMHLLSFLLTADHTMADECFVSGLENCSKENGVFRDWARSWARRTIIRTAVRMLRPRRNHSTAPVARGDPVNCEFARSPEAKGAIGSILELEDFERFIFVMSVLERYSEQDCSVLLDCSRQDVRETRVRVLQQIAGSYSLRTVAGPGFNSNDYEEARARKSHAAPALAIGFGAGFRGVTKMEPLVALRIPSAG
jgi:hypothetical protein